MGDRNVNARFEVVLQKYLKGRNRNKTEKIRSFSCRNDHVIELSFSNLIKVRKKAEYGLL